MSLSDVEIAQITAELAPRLINGSIGKAYLRDDFTFVLEVGRDRLLVAAHPRASRLHLEERVARGAANAPAGPFAMAARRRLTGQRLASLGVLVAGERVVVLEVGPSRERLVAELTGPHANVFLVGPDGLIGAALRRSTSTTRALSPGQPYTPPPPAPATVSWRGRARFGEPPGVAEGAARYYSERLRVEDEAAARERAAVALRREATRLERLETALVGDLGKADEAAGLRKLADLLLAHLHELPGRGAQSVVVPDDFEDGSPLTIPLDPALDVRQNAARLYKQHKRLGGSRARIGARLAQTRQRLAELRARLSTLASIPLDEARSLAPAPEPAAARRKAREAPRLPYREFASQSGEVIWVGRSAADNDTLTFRHARGADLWLHARDCPGSHVVVPQRTNAPLKEQTLLDAATLAVHYSELKEEAQVDVIVTQVKHVRRPRGAPPGRVFTSETRTVRVRMEADRLDRLLARASAV